MQPLAQMTVNNIGHTVTITKLGSPGALSDEKHYKVAGTLDTIGWDDETNPHPNKVVISGAIYVTSEDSEFEPANVREFSF